MPSSLIRRRTSPESTASGWSTTRSSRTSASWASRWASSTSRSGSATTPTSSARQRSSGQLAAELQAMVDLGEDLKTQIDKLKDKPASDWAPLQKKWMEQGHEIMKRADPHANQEYNALNIDHPATTGLENLSGILNSAA